MTSKWEIYGRTIRSRRKIKILELLGKPVRPSTLSKKLKISISHVSNILRELKKDGLVECLNEKLRFGRIYKRTKLGKEFLDYVKEEEK